MTVSRRRFLEGSALGVGLNLLPHVSALASGSGSSIEVILDESRGTVSPDLYGYLLENIGTAIYDGIWVGEHSKVPHVEGIRKAVIDHLRDIKAGVIRWPGGCFADYYDWEDGIGPRAKRPRRTNQWTEELPPEAPNGPQRFDPNQFGTPEFLKLCALTGGRPFMSVNARSLSPQSFFRWVEYCNSPADTTTLSEARARDGSKAPHGVRYWGVGNEVWGAGGNMSAEEYATLYKRFTANVPRYGVDLCFVASGPPPGWTTDWLREFMRICTSTILPIPIHGMSLHYYATLPLNYLKRGQTLLDAAEINLEKVMPIAATGFGKDGWYQTQDASARLEGLIDSYWQALGEFDPKRTIKLSLDEWGAIYRRPPRENPANLTGRGVTMRDAVSAALTLDIINSRCDVLNVANFTGLVNQEGGLMQADGAKFCLTPIYHVFKMYSGHQGGRLLRTLFEVPLIPTEETGQPGPLNHLSGSATLRGNQLTLTVTNRHASQSHDARIILRGADASSGSVATLVHSDLNAQNSFENPSYVTPSVIDLKVNGASFRYSFPAASVTSFTLLLSRTG